MRPEQPDESTDDNAAVRYESFLLAEYEQIAAAYFKAGDTITGFFKHYLVVAALPASLFALLISEKVATDIATLNRIKFIIPPACLAVAVIGTLVLLYIANLWFDQILYARVVNGLRSYFTRRSGLSFAELSRIRRLPISANQPDYRGKRYFYWVVFAVVFVNACYFGMFSGFLYLWRDLFGISSSLQPPGFLGGSGVTASTIGLVTGVGFFFASLRWYRSSAQYRENSYLKSQTIGIDIDGVLNRHREHFADILKVTCGKEVDPKLITRIPVRKCKALGLSIDDEAQVFHDLDYWTKMPLEPQAQAELDSLRRFFPGHKIHLYTNRPWPKFDLIANQDKRKQCEQAWRASSSITGITEAWLAKHNLKYDALIVEGTPQTRTRFTDADEGLVSLFIEDDLLNAKRLALSCETVVLLDAPYNQCPDAELPPNIVRVSEWENVIGVILRRHASDANSQRRHEP